MASRKRPPENLDESSCHLIVGDEPCTFVQVRDVLYGCASAGKLWPKLLDIATSLEIPTECITSLKRQINTDTITYSGGLLEILLAWRGKFSAEAKLQNLINILERNGLADCADSLRIHFNEFDDAYVVSILQKLKPTAKSSTWEDLPEHLKRWMNSKAVIFQGNKNKLEQLTAQIATPVDEKILLELGERKTPHIVNNQVPEHIEYYVHRFVTCRNVLKIDVLKQKCKDVFVIEGMEKHQLSPLVPDYESADVSGNQLEKLTVRFVLLQHPQDFDKISRLASTQVHWVKYGNGRLEFIKSSGSVVNLQKHVDDFQDSFSEEELACRHERVVVIADSPGMGKTCLLANIAYQIISEQSNLVVRFIVLKEFVDALSKQEINTESIVKQISEKSSEYEFGRKLVEHALKTQKCVLLFDGLDEVLSNQMTVAMEILKAVATLPSVQVYVATRPHFRNDVENEMNVLAHTILPFNESNQINFLTKFWTMKGAIGNDELAKFTNQCVNQLSLKMTDIERNIAGIPLQCKLLAEVYEEHVIRCSVLGYKNYEGTDSFVMINSMFKIYERHIDMRFEKIRKQEYMGARFSDQYETIKQAHMYFALELLFPEHAEEFKNLNSSSIPLNELCGLGILEATNSNDIRFVHRTFAEFLIAMLAHEYIQTNNQHRDILLSSLLKLALKDLTINNPFYEYIEFESFDFNFPVICYFLNGFSKNETGNEIAIDYHEEAIPYYIASAFHNYENIPHIVTRSVTNINPIETDELFKRNLFYVTAMRSGLELMEMVCSVIDVTQIYFMSFEEADESDAFMITPLHLAVQRGHYGLVDYLLKKLEGKLTQLRYLMHFCVFRSAYESNAIVEDKIQIIKLLVNMNKEWIEEQLPDQTTPLMQPFVHVELLELLILEGANLNIRVKYGNTVLHAITENNVLTPESYHRVLNALNQRGFQHFNEPNSDYMTPLHLAVEKVELLSITLELFISKGADFNAVNKYNNTALHVAVIFQLSERILDSLIKAGADENARGQYNRTVLHRAAATGNLAAWKYFFLRGHDVNVTDENVSTPLHLAVALSEANTHEVVLLLAEHGADLNAIDKFGRTPLSIANGGQSKVEARTKEYLEMELLLMKWVSEIIQHNIDKLGALTNFESHLLQKLVPKGILLENDVRELESIETDVSRATKFYTLLLTKKSDFKILLTVFSNSSNAAVLGIFVKEFISFLYNTLMKLDVTVVRNIMNTKGYADALTPFVQTLEEIDRQTYSDKLSIVQLLCTLNPQVLPPKQSEMYTPLQLAFLSNHDKKLELIEKIMTHNVNPSEIQDLFYLCLADTGYKYSEVDERKRILTSTLQKHPSLYQNLLKHHPLLAPNIHVDLIIHVINLGVDVIATNEKQKNLLHLCAEYLTPEKYDRVVNALVEKHETELFHSRDVYQNTPLHVAVIHLELFDSTFQLFSSAKVDFNAVDKYNNTALHSAVISQRSERILDSLIKAGADEKARGQVNRTVLHFAASSGNLIALQYFLLRGHDVNVTDEKVSTPLHLAVIFSRTNTHEVVVLLVENGADVNAINKDGETPLDIANDGQYKVEARTKEYLEMELLLMKWGSEIIQQNMDKLSSLTNFEAGLLKKLTSSGILTERDVDELESNEAVLFRTNKFFTMLLTTKSDLKILLSAFSESNNGAVLSIFVKELISFLYKAVMNLGVTGVHHVMHTKGYSDILESFVKTLEEIDRQEYADKLSIVQLICTLRPQVSYSQHSEMYTPGQLALSHNQKLNEFIQRVIAHNVNQPEIQDLVYLCLANTHEHSEMDERKRIISNILQSHPFLFHNQPNHYPLLAPNIHVDLIIHVINLGVDVHVTNESKENLLHLCPKYLTPEEYHRVVNALVERQETELFHSRDEDQNTPLHAAVANLELLDSTIKLFSSTKVDFNAVDKYNDTVLHNAVFCQRSERILDSLIKAGADEKARGYVNRTVLHCAAGSGNLTALKYFILRGHDVNVTDEEGSTPLPLALEHSKTSTHEMVVLLVEHGADVNAIDQFGTTPLFYANRSESKVEARTKEFLESIINRDAESICIKYHIPIIRKNRDKLIALTNFESGLLQKLITGGILTEPELEELGSFETSVTRGNKFYTMLLTRKYDFKILLNAFSDSNNRAVLSIFVKELISYLYRDLMNLEVTGVHHFINTRGYANVLQRFVQTFEEIDRQTYSDKLSIVQVICTLNPQVLPPKRPEMYTPLQLAFYGTHDKKLELIQKIIKHNVNLPEIQDLVYLCLANSHEHSEVYERKCIITNILQNHPSLFQNQPKYYPLLAPKIHVDLIIHVINLGVNVHATNEKKQNLLHLCAEYLTPEEYHRVVNAIIIEKEETELFHSRDEDQNTPLHVAVIHLELLDSAIQLFSSAKVDFNAVDKYNDTALHNAVIFKRNERILDSLIKAGADENARGYVNRTVLHRAASYGNLTALKYFLLRGHDVNVTDEQGSTPLHLAVALSETNTHEVVVLLVEHGADVNAINKDGETPLDIANLGQSKVEARTKEFLESIIKESRFIKCHSTIIRKMDKLSTLTNFESGLLQRLTTGGILTEPELESIKTGIKKLISYLYTALMNLEVTEVHHVMNTKGYADLHLRFVETLDDVDRQEYADKFSIVQLLCTLNPQVFPPKRSEMYTPLQLALRSHHDKQFEFIQKIITHNVDVNEPDSRGFTPLHYAVRQKPIPPRVIEIAKLLIENGADPDAVNQQGHTVLHMAPYFLTTEIYDQLILLVDSSGRKNSLKLLNHNKHSPVHLAVLYFDPLLTTLDIFKSNGINFNGQDNDGNSVAFLAVEGGRNAEFLRTLFTYGADWKIPNKNQENALHVAALYGNVSALELFIALGCDVNAKNVEGRTPLHNAFLAKKRGEHIMTEHEIVVMLLKERVDVTAKDTHGKTSMDLAKERLQTGKVKHKTVKVLGKYSSKRDFTMSLKSWLKVKT